MGRFLNLSFKSIIIYTDKYIIVSMELKVIDVRKADFEAECNRLANKAKKLGFEFSCTFREMMYEKVGKYGHEYNAYYVYDVTLPEYAVNGWELVATLVPAEDAKRFTAMIFSETPVPVEYWKADTHKCDHCGRNVAHRAKLYLIHNQETDQWMKIGTSCIKDYIGGGLLNYAKWAKDFKELNNFDSSEGTKYYAREYLIAMVVSTIRRMRGFVSAKNMGSTYENLLIKSAVTSEDEKKAKAICNWYDARIQNMSDNEFEKLTDYERNLYALLGKKYYGNGYELKMMCSAVPYYEKQQVNDENSQYVGKIGSKITVDVMVRSTRLCNTAYGNTWLLECVDKSNNVIKCFVTEQSRNGKMVEKMEKLDLLTITGTVKKHDDFRGAKSTLLTRVNFTL